MMSRNRILGLLVAAVLVLGIALLVHSMRGSGRDEAVGNRILPALAAGLNEISEVRITEAGNKPFVTLRRSADKKTWGLVERDGYPADMGKLRDFLIKLST